MAIASLDLPPALIDQVHDRLLAAIVDGTFAPGHRLTQDGIAEMLGVSRQPVSHAIQVLKRRGLLVEAGKRGVVVAPIQGRRILDLYRVREALDGLAGELAAERVRAKTATAQEVAVATGAIAVGVAIAGHAPVAMLIDADVVFHSAIYQLSGNTAIAETVAEQWPHFRRSMGLVLATSELRTRVWAEHRDILDAILTGDTRRAGRLARAHTAQAGEDAARRIDGEAAVA
jgi:DNA-binding GntR family transcriptional regulator